jgi:hypothetical protein
MGKPSRRKLEKKRKAQKERRRPEPQVLAYTGNKYRRDELGPFHFTVESAIYECYVLTKRKLMDNHARQALTELIALLRHGPLPEWKPNEELVLSAGGEVELIKTDIRFHVHEYLQKNPHPGRDNMIGVLRSILGSIDMWGSINPASRGYLEYIADFCLQAGVTVEMLPLNSPSASNE